MSKRKIRNASSPRIDLPKFRSGEEFDALSDEDKEKVWNYYNREIPFSESRPLSKAERARFERIRRKPGRPKIGQGAKVVAVTMEKGFLARVDDYARRHQMKRAELITEGLRMVMGEK